VIASVEVLCPACESRVYRRGEARYRCRGCHHGFSWTTVMKRIALAWRSGSLRWRWRAQGYVIRVECWRSVRRPWCVI